MMFIQFWPLLLSLGGLGAVAGFLAGLLGIGGGVVLVPGLFFLFQALGYSDPLLMHVAIGTSLAVIVPTGLSSALAHYRRGSVLRPLLYRIGPGILAGAGVGALIADSLSGESLQVFFAFSLLALALLMLVSPAASKKSKTAPDNAAPSYSAGLTMPWSSLAGFVIGTVSALMGIGGATLSVPYMALCRVTIREAVGTAAALGLVIAVPAALFYILTGWDETITMPFTFGYLNLLAWGLIIPFSVLCAPIGARVAHYLPVRWLRVVFMGFMILVALRMMHDVFSS